MFRPSGSTQMSEFRVENDKCETGAAPCDSKHCAFTIEQAEFENTPPAPHLRGKAGGPTTTDSTLALEWHVGMSLALTPGTACSAKHIVES